MSKLYTVHHETSAAQSRKLTLWFWSGVLLSFISYSLVAWIFLSLIFNFSTTPNHNLNLADELLEWSFLVGLGTSLAVLYGYYLASREIHHYSAIERAEMLGAETLGTPQYPAETRYRNIVEEMAVAAGIRPPDIMINRDDGSINAFVIGGAHHSVAISVTAGALRYLSRDELQALVAHEFGHIVDDDITLYGRLTAMIQGYRLLADVRKKLFPRKDDGLNEREKHLIANANPKNDAEALAVRQLAYASAHRRREDAAEMENAHLQSYFGGYGIIIMALIFVLSTYSLLLTFYARIMQAAIAREREWMADAKAVQFTRNSEALVGAFKKVLALQRSRPLPDAISMESRHLLLINYLQKEERTIR